MSAPAWGDPLGCRYHWTPPGRIDAYGDSVRALANKVDSAADAFGRVARIDEAKFAGEAADSLRTRGERREQETIELRKNLRGLGRAINAYAEALGRHRDALGQLRDFAERVGLEVREGKVWPPVEVLPKDASRKEVDAWHAAWDSYRTAYDLKIEMRSARLQASRELLKALADHADVHRDEGDKVVKRKREDVAFGELRREAADEAREAVEARDAVGVARDALKAAKQAEADAYSEYQRLLRSGASDEELLAHAEKTRALQDETNAAKAALAEAKETAAREQREASAAARKLEQAEAGKPPKPTIPPPLPHAHGGPADGRPLASDRVRSRLG